MTVIEQKIDQVLRPLLKDEGVDLATLRLFVENDQTFLEIGVKRFEGETDLNSVEVISRFISDWLDKYDFIEDSYILDVYAVSAK